MKKTKLLSIMLIATLILNVSATSIHAAPWEDYLGFDGKPGHTWYEAANGKITNVSKAGWTADLDCIGHYIWGAQMSTKNISYIRFGQKYQLHCILKSSNCDKWIFIKISDAYGKWIRLKRNTSTTINEIFTAQANAWEDIVFAFGGEYGNSDLIANTNYSSIPNGKVFIAANPDPDPATSTTITCSGFYLGNVINKTSLSKIKRTGSKAKITMKRVKNIKGYEIQYSTTKKFKIKKTKVISSKKNSYTIKKLKKNTKYYVRTRAYVKASNEKVYSKWSKIKTIPKK